MLKQENMKHTSKELKKIFLDRTEKLPSNAGKGGDRNIRKMRKRLHDEFDNIWIRYNENKATYNQWQQALDKWLKAECI